MAIEKKGNKPTKKDEAVQDESIFQEESHKNVEIETTDTTSTEPLMSISAVEEMLQKQEERWSQRFNQFAQKIKLSKAKDELEADENYVSELEDDWLDNPAVFFAFSINFSIHGDVNRGVETKPPQGAVKFKPIVRQKRQGRKGVEVISVSSVKVHSKAVAKYLRGHSQFGIAFFENMDSVLNMDAGWAHKLVEANNSIQRLSDQQVIARCRQFGLPVGTDVLAMRKSLVEDMASKALQQQDRVLYQKLKTAEVDEKGRVTVEKKIG